MINSTRLQHDVQEELEWEPSVDASKIGVAAIETGIVTLTGTVATYAEKVNAERAAKRVSEVRVVANDIDVRPIGSMKRTDTDIAQAVLRALEWDIAVPHEKIKARVDNGWVTLEGDVALQFQRAAAEIDARGIQVDAKDSMITLRGKVRTWAERDEAERAAWAAPGVLAVKDELTVGILHHRD